MAKVLLYYIHPAQRFSRANKALQRAADAVSGLTRVDLYAEYPRHNIDVDKEQARLREHDVIVFQFPVYWYSSPALMKEWQDLVLEHGFAYGNGGTALKGKTMMLALTAAGPEEAYSEAGYQNYPLRTFLTPFEQTAVLCEMTFLAPYVLYGALGDTGLAEHAEGYGRLLEALRDDRLDTAAAAEAEGLSAGSLPLLAEV